MGLSFVDALACSGCVQRKAAERHEPLTYGAGSWTAEPRSAEEVAPAVLVRIEVDRLITTYAFDDLNRAVSDVLAGTVVKPVMTW